MPLHKGKTARVKMRMIRLYHRIFGALLAAAKESTTRSGRC